MMNLERKAVKGVKWTGASTTVCFAVSLFQLALLAHYLSPDEFGQMGMVMVALGFAQAFSDFGVSAALIHRQDVSKEQLSSLYWFNLACSFIVGGLFWLFSPYCALMFDQPGIEPLLGTISVFFLLIGFSKQFEILLQRSLHFHALSMIEMCGALFGLLTAIICVCSGLTLWALVWAFLANWGLKAVLLVLLGIRRFRPSLHFCIADLDGFIKFGLFQLGERIVSFLNQRFDQLLIGLLLGAESLGFYHFAFNLVYMPVLKINQVLNRVSLPVFAKVQEEQKRLRNGYVLVVRCAGMVNGPILLGLAATAPIAVPLLFGEKWTEAVLLVQILSFAALVMSSSNPVGALLLSMGRADLGLKWNLGRSLVTLPATFFAAYWGGAEGVAICLLLLLIVFKFPAYRYLIRPLVGACGSRLIQATLIPLGISVLMGLSVWVIPLVITPWESRFVFAVQVLTGVLFYALLLLLFDRKAVSQLRNLLFPGGI